MFTHFDAVFFGGKLYFQHLVKLALLLKCLWDFGIVKIITHFEAVFLREKGLPTACINWIATKTLHVELFSLDDHRF